MSQLFTGYTETLQTQLKDTQYALALLQEKYDALLSGQQIRCAVPDCGNLLGARLTLGFATCSDHCTGELRRSYRLPLTKRQLAAAVHALPPVGDAGVKAASVYDL